MSQKQGEKDLKKYLANASKSVVAFQGAKKRKTKEAAAAVRLEPQGGDTPADKPQIQVLNTADDDDEERNTYRRKTVCTSNYRLDHRLKIRTLQINFF